jgi:hypothetical protein
MEIKYKQAPIYIKTPKKNSPNITSYNIVGFQDVYKDEKDFFIIYKDKKTYVKKMTEGGSAYHNNFLLNIRFKNFQEYYEFKKKGL